VKAKLYSIAVSHPARTAGLMLRHKGIETEIVDMPPGAQQIYMRARGFDAGTVPAIEIDGRKVQGSLEIAQELERLVPEPPLYPADAEERAAVQRAERWGEAVLQPIPRNIFRWAVAGDGELRRALADAVGMPQPAVAATAMKPVAWYYSRLVSGSTEESIKAQLATLPAHIDHVDALIEEGVIGGEQLNAADFQIATSVRVLLNFPQLRPLIEGRPAGELAMRVIPDFGRPMPVKLPADWVPEPAAAGVSS
jgi:glutathione S-transferase